MSKENKPRRGAGLIAFVLGVILGKSVTRPLTHILYIAAIVLTFVFAQNGPLNTYMQERAKVDVDQNAVDKAVEQAEPELANMKKIANQLKVANETLILEMKEFREKTKSQEKRISELNEANETLDNYLENCRDSLPPK